ncbi:MAG: radical SAM protein [Candidatus Omnitrophica bacterium]|jgi:MoaA/NifB/PqqE/SkfB family radical SAM enzyme|nr:radical SAM protein [Candidatus Omnitrophota bacterium]
MLSKEFSFKRINNYLKYFLNGDRLKRYATHLNYYPLFIEVEVTTNCILSCPGCARTIAPKEFLGHNTSLETMQKIEPIFHYTRLVTFVGPFGDPFMSPNFWEFHHMAKAAGSQTMFFTNAMLMNSGHIDKLFSAKTDCIGFSLDSIEPKLYESIKKGTDFNKVMNIIRGVIAAKRRFKLKKPVIAINYVIQKKNIHELSEVVKFAAKEGIEKIWFTGLICHNQESVDNSIFSIDRTRLDESVRLVKKLGKRYGVGIRLPQFNYPDVYRMCCAPWQTMSIYYNGDVCACTHFRFPKPYYFYVKGGKIIQGKIDYPALLMGNINEEGILKIWNNEKYQNLRSGIKDARANYPCRSCYYPYGWH